MIKSMEDNVLYKFLGFFDLRFFQRYVILFFNDYTPPPVQNFPYVRPGGGVSGGYSATAGGSQKVACICKVCLVPSELGASNDPRVCARVFGTCMHSVQINKPTTLNQPS